MCTLDWLSEGRIDFGIGVGWNKEEVEACGYTWEDRGARCDEFLEVMRRLWTEPVVDFKGQWVNFEALSHGPETDPEAACADHCRRVCRCRVSARRSVAPAGMASTGPPRTQPGRCCKRLDATFAKAGRTRGKEFEIIITPPMSMAPDAMQAYAELGVHELVVNLGGQEARAGRQAPASDRQLGEDGGVGSLFARSCSSPPIGGEARRGGIDRHCAQPPLPASPP